MALEFMLEADPVAHTSSSRFPNTSHGNGAKACLLSPAKPVDRLSDRKSAPSRKRSACHRDIVHADLEVDGIPSDRPSGEKKRSLSHPPARPFRRSRPARGRPPAIHVSKKTALPSRYQRGTLVRGVAR